MTCSSLRNTPSLMLAAALFASACAHPSTRSPTMSAETQERNKRSTEKLFQTFNQGDLAAIDELVGPEYVGAQGDRGPAGFRAVVTGLRNAFPDLHYTVDELVAEEDRVAIRWHWTGTHKGPFRAFPPT